eukprot:scaffold7444_cov90-Skeletonema_dohrnii-CCMP3373.AAC.8
MTRIILPFIAFAGMLGVGSAHSHTRTTSCSDLQTESECKKVLGCKWGATNGASPVGKPPRARCHGKSREKPDKPRLADVYVRLDADYGYEDTGDEVDN